MSGNVLRVSFMLNQLIFSTGTGSMMHLYHTVDASVNQFLNNSSRISNPIPNRKDNEYKSM